MTQSSTTLKSADNQPKYIPGVCNIGPAERAKRRQSGIIALIVAIVLFVVLIEISAPKGWRLLLILPLAAAASGFLQDVLHFCAGFGMKGLYNVINSVGITDDVTSEEFRSKDQHKALLILGMSLAIGVIIAGFCTL
jgi:hypothetical protein